LIKYPCNTIDSFAPQTAILNYLLDYLLEDNNKNKKLLYETTF